MGGVKSAMTALVYVTLSPLSDSWYATKTEKVD